MSLITWDQLQEGLVVEAKEFGFIPEILKDNSSG